MASAARKESVLNIIRAACFPIGILLSVALPVWLVHKAGGWPAIGLFGKIAVIAAPLVVLGLDGYFLWVSGFSGGRSVVQSSK